jgi:AraC family transcriptional regulator
MQTLQKGKFFGISKQQYHINGITIVNSSFHNFSHCPWHYHNDAHFAFTTKGTLTETHRSKKIKLSPGCLVYNHSQEPHWNDNYSENVSALHIDMGEEWFHTFDIMYSQIEGVHVLESPLLKQIFFKIFKEISVFDEASSIAIESLILQALKIMLASQETEVWNKPTWVNKLRDLLYSKCSEKLTLASVASELNLHPVYLCQQFPLFFNCNFGEYIRKLRIEKAVRYILNTEEMRLTEISYACGFADQSHFIRTFKNIVGVTPLHFRKYLS